MTHPAITPGSRPLQRLAAACVFCLAAGAASAAAAFEIRGSEGTRLEAREIATIDGPWAMTFLPDRSMLVTEQRGRLLHVSPAGETTPVGNVPEVAYGGQGGLGDVVADPDFADNGLVYLSHARMGADGDTRGGVVVRARLDVSGEAPVLREVTELWRQQPFVSGSGHFSHRLAFGPAGTPQAGYLFITSGDRQKQTPAQAMDGNLGKVVRLNTDGSVPEDNPFADAGGVAEQFYSIGHRNLLGIDFDADGGLWAHEMGPAHGDELNRVVAGGNYGWPEVSEGDRYSGRSIPAHDTRDAFEPPAVAWVPSIGPAGLVIYDGGTFAGWQGDALIGGLVAEALVRVALDGAEAREVERYEWGERVREVEQGPDGATWVLEDGAGGRLLRLMPAA
ncbi:PQQ-dependent sugar dehydrogenase [Salinisphaera orenii]|uniref:Dehydrogenase n=1 Tax=Salinisphaera orenii YIM 95161 TaxID=1051139 RepID=A0A423QAY4_9GAMM|nr:PQQ-dependent sugar dehydrogenase [Salinisphaera halophila]ROO37725.1 dehydrogenase [Salinisphaera halophila YIM 95161]